MADQEVREEETEDVEVDGFEVSDEPEEQVVDREEATPKADPYMEQIEALRRENEELKQSFSKVGAQGDLIANLTNALKPAEAQPAKVKDYRELAKELKDTFYDKPDEAMATIVEHVIKNEFAPVVGHLMQKIEALETGTQKAQVVTNDSYKFAVETYPAEVDTAYKQLRALNVPDAYVMAAKQVAANHVDEIVTLKAQKIVEEKGQAKVSEKPSAPDVTARSVQRPSQKVRLTSAEAHLMEARGLNVKDILELRELSK